MRVKGDLAPFGLRMPPEIKELLTFTAKQRGRSMNAEVLDRLIDTFTWTDLWELAESKGVEEKERDLWVKDFAKTFGVRLRSDGDPLPPEEMAALKSEIVNEVVLAIKLGLRKSAEELSEDPPPKKPE